MIINLWFTYSHVNRLVSDCTDKCPHLIDKHDGENGLVDEPGFAERAEREKWRSERTSGSTCGRNEDTNVATAKCVRVQQSSTYGKPWTLFRMILS